MESIKINTFSLWPDLKLYPTSTISHSSYCFDPAEDTTYSLFSPKSPMCPLLVYEASLWFKGQKYIFAQ